MPLVYNWDPETRIYTGASEARPSPLQLRVFLLPAHSTFDEPLPAAQNEANVRDIQAGCWVLTPDYRGWQGWTADAAPVSISAVGEAPDPGWTQIAPPPAVPNQICRLVDGAWQVIADYVGVTVYRKVDGAAMEITEEGQEPGLDWTLLPPPPIGANQCLEFIDGSWQVFADYRGQTFYGPDGVPVTITERDQRPDPSWTTAAPTIEQVRAYRVALLRGACAGAIVGGFISSALGAPHSYPSGITDQTNLQQTAAAVGGMLWCADAAGQWSFTAHTQAQGAQVLADFIAFRNTLQQRLAILVAAVRAAGPTAAEVNQVVWA